LLAFCNFSLHASRDWRTFFRSPWTRLDLFLTLAALAELLLLPFLAVRVLRPLRVLRVARFATAWGVVRALLASVGAAGGRVRGSAG
jgi:hypothetical protein